MIVDEDSIAMVGSSFHKHQGLRSYTLIYRAGYSVLAKITNRQKNLACRFISRRGPFVKSSSNVRIFAASSVLCCEQLVVQGLLHARVTEMAIFCYGMKSNVSRFQNIMIHGVQRQIDVGTNINTSCIPVL
jgi:hypothetical protein